MSEINKIPSAQFLMDSGLLFEINRTILHPLGLALEIKIDDNEKPTIGDLWDYRDDPEGMLYDDETLKLGVEKLQKFMNEFGHKKHISRKQILGYIIQEMK